MIVNSTKKPEKWKKHSVLKVVLATFFGRNLVYVWFEICPSYLSRKKGTLETFLSLGLIISRSRPRLQKTFPRFPFFYFDNLDKSQIRRRQIFPQSSQHNFQNKTLLLKNTSFNFLEHIWVHQRFFCGLNVKNCARLHTLLYLITLSNFILH